mmetsp:Transcript_63264/g.179954  ORF Transcript_63264/g.179954 Transcript_63264/m.179954 type:complete len:335 (+) Transcript_63264:372-1376(+)
MMRCTSAMSSERISAILSASRPLSASRSMLSCVLLLRDPGSTFWASEQRVEHCDLPMPTRSSRSAGAATSAGSLPPETAQTSTATAFDRGGGRLREGEWTCCKSVVVVATDFGETPWPSCCLKLHAEAPPLSMASTAAWPPPSGPGLSATLSRLLPGAAAGMWHSTFCGSASRSKSSPLRCSRPQLAPAASATSAQMPSCAVATSVVIARPLTFPIAVPWPAKSTSSTEAPMCCLSSWTRKSKDCSSQVGAVVFVAIAVRPVWLPRLTWTLTSGRLLSLLPVRRLCASSTKTRNAALGSTFWKVSVPSSMGSPQLMLITFGSTMRSQRALLMLS